MKLKLLALIIASLSYKTSHAKSIFDKNCPLENINEEKNLGLDISSSILSNVLIYGAIAVAAAFIAPPLLGAIGIAASASTTGLAVFSGLIAFDSLIPALRRGSTRSFNFIEECIDEISSH